MNPRRYVVCLAAGVLSLTMATTAAAQAAVNSRLPIAIEPYVAEVDPLTGEAYAGGEGYRIVHRDFDVELEQQIVKVPILGIQQPGKHYATVEARAKGVAERLVHALDLMKSGGSLIVMEDNWNAYRLADGDANTAYGVFVVHGSLPTAPLRIITLYAEDVRRFPFVTDLAELGQPLASEDEVYLPATRDMAEYVKAIIEAHYMLFWKRSAEITEYEALQVDQPLEGKIFKEIFIRAHERATMMNRGEITAEDIRDALGRVAMSQRYRLVRMAVAAPSDWCKPR